MSIQQIQRVSRPQYSDYTADEIESRIRRLEGIIWDNQQKHSKKIYQLKQKAQQLRQKFDNLQVSKSMQSKQFENIIEEAQDKIEELTNGSKSYTIQIEQHFENIIQDRIQNLYQEILQDLHQQSLTTEQIKSQKQLPSTSQNIQSLFNDIEDTQVKLTEKIHQNLSKSSTSIQQESENRQETEEAMLNMLREVVGDLRQQIQNERNERASSEEVLTTLLNDAYAKLASSQQKMPKSPITSTKNQSSGVWTGFSFQGEAQVPVTKSRQVNQDRLKVNQNAQRTLDPNYVAEDSQAQNRKKNLDYEWNQPKLKADLSAQQDEQAKRIRGYKNSTSQDNLFGTPAPIATAKHAPKQRKHTSQLVHHLASSIACLSTATKQEESKTKNTRISKTRSCIDFLPGSFQKIKEPVKPQGKKRIDYKPSENENLGGKKRIQEKALKSTIGFGGAGLSPKAKFSSENDIRFFNKDQDQGKKKLGWHLSSSIKFSKNGLAPAVNGDRGSAKRIPQGVKSAFASDIDLLKSAV